MRNTKYYSNTLTVILLYCTFISSKLELEDYFGTKKVHKYHYTTMNIDFEIICLTWGTSYNDRISARLFLKEGNVCLTCWYYSYRDTYWDFILCIWPFLIIPSTSSYNYRTWRTFKKMRPVAAIFISNCKHIITLICEHNCRTTICVISMSITMVNRKS